MSFYASAVSEHGPPSGTVTFLFSDIVGSTSAWESNPAGMHAALAIHDELCRAAIERRGGYIFATGGDGFCVSFARAEDAVTAAIEMQQGIVAHRWDESATVEIRIGVHTGEAFERGGDYFGPEVNRAARIMASAHGGQIVCSDVTERIVRLSLRSDVALQDLGDIALRGLSGRQRVFGVLAAALPHSFPALRGEAVVHGNLPPSLVPLVGRRSDLSAIGATLLTARVVTLSGPGGVGKTSLALEAGLAARDKFPDGVWFVDLATVLDGDAVDRATLAALAVQEQPGVDPIATLLQALSGQRMLVILDNCEHVRPRAAAVVDALRIRPTVTVLATSRERLGLRDEREIAVRPLSSGDEHAPAIELFIERCARPTLLDDPVERGAIVEICQRLDGLPLAVELAASRCRTMQPSAMAERIRDSLRLISDRNVTDPRRATIDGTLQWSYDLLGTRDRAVLERLGVMVGHFDLDAAERVCGFDGLDSFDVDEAVGSLVEKSLVDHDDGWYRLLESTRQFALGRLDESGTLQAARVAHLDWSVAYALSHDEGVRTTDEGRWARRLDHLWPNVRAAYEFSLTCPEPTMAFTLAVCLTNEIVIRRFDGLDWPERALDHFGRREHPLLADVVARSAFVKLIKADFDGMEALATEAVERAGTRELKDRTAEMVLGYALTYDGRPDDALRILGPALRSAVSNGDVDSSAGALAAACGNAALLGGSDRSFVEDARRVSEMPGVCPTGRLSARIGLTFAALGDGDLERAKQHVTSALAIVEETRSLAQTGAARALASWVTQPTLDEAVEAIRGLLRAGHVAFAWLWVPSAVSHLVDTDAELSARLIGAARAANPSTLGSGAAAEGRVRLLLGDARTDELLAVGAGAGLAAMEEFLTAVRSMTDSAAPPA